MNRKVFLLLRVIIVTLLILGPARADISLHYSYPWDGKQELVLATKDERAVLQIQWGGKSYRILFDRSRDRMFLIVDTDRVYMDLDAMIAGLGELSGLLTNMLPGLSNDLKNQLDRLLAPSGSNSHLLPDISPTGEIEEVRGFGCQITLFHWLDTTAKVCLADPASVGIAEEDFQLLRQMIMRQVDTFRLLEATLGIRIPELGFSTMDQVPLRLRNVSGPYAGSTVILQGIDPETDPARMTVPSDYRLLTPAGH